MLLDEDERRIDELVATIVRKRSPVMAHNERGLIADSFVVDMLEHIHKATRRAAERFCQQRNAQSSINLLPPELLVLIASFLPYGSLDAAALVCRHWNRALSSDSSLWDAVAISFLRQGGPWQSALQKALDRSQSRMRKLTLHYPSEVCSALEPECVRLPTMVTSVMHSLVDLHLDLSGCFCSGWNVILSTPAPNLHSLALTGPNNPAPFRLQDNLFDGTAPRLRVVWLTYLFLPSDPGAALNGVSEVAYFDVPVISMEEMQHICCVCPKLIYLTVTAQTYDVTLPPQEFTPPKLRSLCLANIIPGGIFEQLVRANSRCCELRVLRPTSLSLAALVFTRIRRIHEIHIYREFSSRSWASVMVTGDDNYSICAEDCTLQDVIDLLVSGNEYLSSIPSVIVSDTLLIMLEAAGVMAALTDMKSLTVLFDNEAHVPCPHLFTGFEGGRFSCGSLETVRLASYAQYTRGFKRSHDEISLSAECVGRWLPASTSRLLLCGARLNTDGDPRDWINCEIATEWDCEGRQGGGIWLETAWRDSFPHRQALCV
ncbi:hypothetical protein EXIGLDRAFT_452497 [Exidia glandulosa HHB12029]|uniref:F-box domain-containing protein n=1 Tax=Exidia glandulosa HHB12029 TaxID=1314781 RepID=A0A165K6K6_EXIGL|nr:hypothetical protein EXIGLDRAFT_452497 [Exidia glandulosa HHB12029]